MKDKYVQEASALLNQRGRILENLTTKTRLQGLERRLFGLLGALAECPPDLPFDNPDTRPLALCLAALTHHREGGAWALAEALLRANAHEWPDDVLMAVDVLGLELWQPVLQGLVDHTDTPAAFRAILLSGFSPVLHGQDDVGGLNWHDLTPGQVEYGIRRGIDGAAWWPDAEAGWTNPERQEDLYWLTLGMYRHHANDAKALTARWLDANPSSPQALTLAAIGSAPEFSSHLHEAILAEQISPWLLAVQGLHESLEFCQHLLENPRFNQAAAQAWTGLTGQKLPLAAQLTLVGHPIDSKAKRVDAGPAGEWLRSHTAQEAPMLSGRPATAEHRLTWLQAHFGEDTRPVFHQLWLERPDIQCLRPQENHFQRRHSLIPEARA